ncbi:MAG: DUF4173 domain-containing protein [Ruminiclostridium sp.]|nr:DUF4173 domain-containing protein [Ruminiclostridium sp.]
MNNEMTMTGAASAPAAPKTAIRPYDCVFVWVSMLLGFLTVRYCLYNPNGFVTTAVSLLIFACSAVYVLKAGNHPTVRQWLLGAAICLFSLVFSITSSVLLHVLCFIFLTAFQFWWVQAVAIKARFVTRFFLFDLLRTVFLLPILEIPASPRAMKASLKGSEKATAVRNALIGMTVTIPLTVVVAGLLAGADSGISSLLDSLTDMLTGDVTSTVFQLILGIPAGFLIFGMFRADAVQKLYPLPSDMYYHEKVQHLGIFPVSGILAGVTPICVLYLMYFVSQANYFLSAFAGKLPADMMYSEYARRGFFELCAIAVINLAVIVSMLSFTKRNAEKKPSPALKVYTCVLSGFTVFIISTALAKMFMYIGEYGLTRLRLYTSWFMVLLAVVFTVLMIRAFVPKFRTASAISAAFIVLFGVLCFSRPDALIAEYNISLYEQGVLETLDVDMLCELSDDAYVVMLDHYDTVRNADKSFERKLAWKLSDYEENPMLTYNLSSQIVASQRK